MAAKEEALKAARSKAFDFVWFLDADQLILYPRLVIPPKRMKEYQNIWAGQIVGPFNR